MRTASVTGCGHTELAGGIAREEITLQHTSTDQFAGLCAYAFFIKGGTTHRTFDVGVFGNLICEDGNISLPSASSKKAGFSIERAAIYRLRQRTQQTQAPEALQTAPGNGRLESVVQIAWIRPAQRRNGPLQRG
jgi:hypothetical protein